MVKIMGTDIRTVKDMNGLIAYLAEKLEWKIDLDDFEDIEDISYDFDAEDIGLKEEAFAKIVSLRQLPPLVDGQKWGIFCVEFDSKRFEVTALRKILSGLIPKRRNSAEHAVWKQKDLLFICFWGNDNERTIGLAHFEDVDFGLPQIKMISCCPAVEDFTQIAVFENRLKNLKWPSNYLDHEIWQTDWSRAFVTGYKQTIKDSSTLTAKLSVEAQEIQKRILAILDVETSNGYVHHLYEDFKEKLIQDMTESQFADMYAQTVVYGLFSARCMDKTQDDFSAEEAIELIPNTNPFLKNLMRECFGSQNNSKLSFDELEIGNVVDLLLHTKTDDIIQDFNRQTGGGREDPVIHFYEEFLTSYDKTQKVQRGVYYTPLPVVKFIVNAVDSIIKNEFGYEDGLASTENKTIKYTCDSACVKRNKTIVVPAIQILDPATGTGTFLRETILRIYENFKNKNLQNLSSEELKIKWNNYVPKHLLPRINGFELMMAPYAVAHMKLAMTLKDTGYDFNSDERLRLYLTNTLEKPRNSDFPLWNDPLALESLAANGVKKNNGINVIIGNPPYNVSSTNKNDWINELIKPYKEGLTERKLNLDDDYIKFLRYAQVIAERSDCSIVGFITNNSYIDGITHRQIRKSLMSTFSKIYIIDLHGNVMKKEKDLNGDNDENVFDIAQGVSICLMVRNSTRAKSSADVYHYNLMGSRDKKYEFLSNTNLNQIAWEQITPDNQKALFVPFNTEKQTNYVQGICVDKLFLLFNSGIQTKCDSLSVGFSQKDVEGVVNLFAHHSVAKLRQLFPNKNDSSGWSFEKARNEIISSHFIYTPYYYRPFDVRYTVYTGKSGGFIGRSREVVMKHVVGHGDNLCLCMMKQFFQDTIYNHVLISNLPIDERTLYSNRGGTYLFPLYVYIDESNQETRGYNFNTNEVKKIEKQLKLSLSVIKSPTTFTGEDLVAYIYAVLYSKKFRITFNEYLKYDFPVVPIPKNKEYFFRMVEIGNKLISIHIPDNFIREVDFDVVLPVLEKYCFDKKQLCVILNNTVRVPVSKSNVYEFEIGGYKPIQKFLKDRKGYAFTTADYNCLKRIISTIEKTEDLMNEIDSIIQID